MSRRAMNSFVRIQAILSIATLSHAHSRWKCPEPRSSDTGIKAGPCGDETNNFDGEITVEIKPGQLRVIFEESIHHTGAPFRISLSNDNSDDTSCVLLDHIPHNDCCSPSLFDESTYTPYVITINIPNVVCEKCSLHLSNPMTDKIGDDGSPVGIGCTDPSGTCFSVYHSCTRPFRIAGDVNEGAVPRSEYNCDDLSSSEAWPQGWIGDDGANVSSVTPGVYRRESSEWSDTEFTLMTVPSFYTDDAGGICGEPSPVTSLSPEYGGFNSPRTTESPSITGVDVSDLSVIEPTPAASPTMDTSSGTPQENEGSSVKALSVIMSCCQIVTIAVLVACSRFI